MKSIVIALWLTIVLGGIATAGPAGDPHRADQWGLDLIGATGDLPDGDGAVVAVVDTGVDTTHPELAGNVLVLPGSDLVSGGKARRDPNGHGTHVAGIIAAMADNNIGITGVAPGATIMPVRVCNERGICDTNTTAEGIRYAADHGADVINISIGEALVTPRLDGSLDNELDAVAYAQKKGVVVVAAAGNLTLPFCQEPGSSAICVGAISRDGLPSYFSNHDVTTLDRYIVAPGGEATLDCTNDVLSTYSRQAPEALCPLGKDYAYMPGTSMASPHVSGVAALLVGEGLEGEAIVDRLLGTATDAGSPGWDPVFGFGLVNAKAATG